MPENPTINTPNSYYQAPLEVPSYVPDSASPIPKQPIDIYGLLNVLPAAKGKKIATRAKTPYELMMEGLDPYATAMPDVAPLQTNLQTLAPLDDSAGLFHSQDGFGKYGYSSILGGGDNEARYADNFRADNPAKFFRPGFHPLEGLWKGVYWGGGFLEKTLESAVVKTGQGLAGIFGATLGNVGNLLSGQKYSSLDQWLAGSTDNILSNVFNAWDESLKERYHYFQEKSDRDNKGFIASLGDGDFWMNDISDGLGFLVSSMFEAGLISKANLGTKVASRVAPLAEDMSVAALNNQSAKASILSRTMDTLGLGTGNALVKNAVDLTTQTLALTAIESASEAKEVQDKVYATFDGKINPETGMMYTEEEKKRLAAAAAGQVFQQNMMILIGPKFLETLVFNRIGDFAKGMMNKAFGQASTEAGKASGAVRSRLGTLSSGTTYNKTSALQNVWKIGSAAAIGFTSEGLFEENIQLAISRNAEQVFGAEDEYYRPGTSRKDIEKGKEDDDLFGSTGRKYLAQTQRFFKGATGQGEVDDELSKSIGIGGLFGVFGGGIHAGTGIKQQAKIDRYWNDRINGVTQSLFETSNFYQTRTEERPDPQNPGKTKPTEVIVTDPNTGQPVLDENKLKGFLNKINNIQGLMDIIRNTEDPTDESSKVPQNQELNKLARNVLFTQLAMEYIKAGKKQLLLSQLTSSSQFSDKDVQALGYEPGSMTDVEKKEMLEKYVAVVEKLDKANSWIDNNVLDNVSEKKQGKFGVTYSKTQKEKRRQEFEAKKAYLRGLAMQNALLDTYLYELEKSEEKLGAPVQPEILSSVLDENGVPITDLNVNLEITMGGWNSKLNAVRNQINVLEKEFAYHLDNFEQGQGELTASLQRGERPATSDRLEYSQIKAEEALQKINDLQAELDKLTSERDSFLNNDKNFELIEEDGNYYVVPKSRKGVNIQALDELEAEKIRRVNGVKREEIGIQKGWIEEEWKNTAALKEEKTKTGKKDTIFSRRMSISRNAYNTYFQREVMDRDNSLGQRKLKLYYKDEAQRIDTKKYINNEGKLLKSVRIQGKVQTILAGVNGQKLMAELNALLDKDLPSNEFAEELKKIIDAYNGRPMIISAGDKTLVNDQIEATNDEYNFVNSIHEFMPLDDRFNDKYYDIDNNGTYVVKAEYEDIFAVADVAKELSDRIDDLEKVRKFLKSIPESVPGDWNNINLVKKRITDVYTETADSIIDTYNQLTNNGQSEISGDSLSTQQDLDLIEQEINELEQLKTIFSSRPDILGAEEFKDFIPSIEKRVEDLNKIKDAVKERLNSRLRENQDFLVDAVNNVVEQIGYNFDGSTKNDDIKNVVEGVVSTEVTSKLTNSLTDLKALMDKEDKSAEDKKVINETYWSINGQVSAIQEIIKNKGKEKVNTEIQKQKKQEITNLEGTTLMKKISEDSYYKDIIDNIDDSVLGALQLLFYQTEFSRIGTASTGTTEKFLDDQPSSPVYKFREDYNLRKFIRNIEKDDSRTPDNTEVSKEDLLQFLAVIQKIQSLEDLQNNLNSSINLVDQVGREKQIVQEKVDKKDNKYDNLIIPSIQQLMFIRKIATFLRSEKVTGDNPGFRNWIYIQAPGGAGKTQTLGTWFNIISGIPRDRVLATAFTEEASRSIKKALLVGETGPKDAVEMAQYIRELTKNKQFDQEVLIIDEFPAIDVQTQKELYDAIVEYTKAKKAANKGEFKVVTMGDTNQLTFAQDGTVIPRPSIIVNPRFFNNDKKSQNDNHPAKMTIVPSLTVNFRTNLFAVTSFADTFRGSSEDNVNKDGKVTSTDPNLQIKDTKGVVILEKGQFQSRLISYLKLNEASPRTKALIVNESKLDQYKKLLTDNGIKVITDPNDEVTRGVYVTTIKNVQGFSFDEVFIDLENNDKSLFSGTSNPDYIYNKAMYVAASRARNLVVATNLPNFQNVEDDSINQLENKALDELQTKDQDFINQRDLEINGAKAILGDQYAKSVVNQAPEKAENKVETVLDSEEDEDDEDLEDEETEEEEEAANPQTQTPDDEIEPEEGADESKGNEVPEGDGIEDNSDDKELVEAAEDNGYKAATNKMWSKIKDTSITAFTKMKDSVVELLFPTGQTTKYKIGDGVFSVRPGEGFENQNLREGDRVIVIPFQQSQNAKTTRNFGYAVITPAIDQDGKEIPNSYRTISILSDNEIDKYKEKPETANLFNAINQNEGRAKGFVSITYQDVSDENGFITSPTKVINELQEGKVVYSQTIKYQYGTDYADMNRQTMDTVIDQFINNYYTNHLNNFAPEQRQAEYDNIRRFYQNTENAQIIIPTNQDLISTATRKAKLRVPPELQSYVRPGRPYLMFRSYHTRGSMQFIGLSRKFLNSNLHNETLEPIRDFINSAKAVKRLLQSKGINNRMGYSRSLSGMLSRLSNNFAKDQNKNEYAVSMTTTENGQRITHNYTFTNTEAERIYNMYALYSEPNTQMIKAESEKEIRNLTNIKRARNYIFEDGEVIYGTIESYNPDDRSFVVKDARTNETKTKLGVIHHSSKSYVGKAQQALDDIMNSNGNIASKFTSGQAKVGFVTDRKEGGSRQKNRYKFMNLLGSKLAPVPKSYEADGSVTEYYEDVIDILEDLFNFAVRGELPGKQLNYINEEGNQQSMEMKFRVPVPLNARDQAGNLEYDYSYGSQNTSRDTTVPNSRFFDTAFTSMLPTRVFVDFTETVEKAEEVEPTIPTEEQQPEEQGEFIRQEAPQIPTEDLTEEEIKTLPFTEIEQRLSQRQRDLLNEYALREGFGGINEFFAELYSNHPDEQEMFRDYIKNCLL